jgi:hypothetical protein
MPPRVSTDAKRWNTFGQMHILESFHGGTW